MKIILEACESVRYDMGKNICVMIDKIKEAAQNQADLICFGESFLQGKDALTFNVAQDVHLAIKIYSVEMKILMEAAKYYNIAIAFGFIEECYRSFYSSYVFIDNNGVIVNMYRSCCQAWRHPQADANRYKGGTGFHAFTYKGIRFLSTLGNDLGDGNQLEKIAEQNFDIILCPSLGCIDEETWINKQVQLILQYIQVNQKMLFIPTLSKENALYSTGAYIHDGMLEKIKMIEI